MSRLVTGNVPPVSNRALHGYSQLDSVVRRVNQVLLGAQVPLRRLDRGVAQKQLDLVQLTAGGPAELRGRATTMVRRDPWNTCGCRVRAEHLPYHLLGKYRALKLVAAIHGPEHVAVPPRRRKRSRRQSPP